MSRVEHSSLSKFLGPDGKRRLVNALTAQSIVRDEKLARKLTVHARLEAVPAGMVVITRGSSEHDLLFILSGEFVVTTGTRVIARRTAGEQVGEMAVVDARAARSATVTAVRDSIVARITEPRFSAVADRFPQLWRRIAQQLAQRLRSAMSPRADSVSVRRASQRRRRCSA